MFLGLGLSGCGSQTSNKNQTLEVATFANERYVVVPYSDSPTPVGHSINEVGNATSTGTVQSKNFSDSVSKPAMLQQWSNDNYTFTILFRTHKKCSNRLSNCCLL